MIGVAKHFYSSRTSGLESEYFPIELGLGKQILLTRN